MWRAWGAALIAVATAGCGRSAAFTRPEPRPVPTTLGPQAEPSADRNTRADDELNAFLRAAGQDPGRWLGESGIKVDLGPLSLLYTLLTNPAKLLDFGQGPKPLDPRMEHALKQLLRRYDADQKR